MSGVPAAGRWLMVVAGLVVVAAVAAAVALMDSPGREREERLDRKRVEDLQLLAARIEAHVEVHEALPGTLAVVADGPGGALVDPATGRPYDYTVTGERSYRLCAGFSTADAGAPDGGPKADAWRHEAGRQCFDLESSSRRPAAVPVPVRD